MRRSWANGWKGIVSMQGEKPGWGKVIGAFFLCGCIAIGVCIIVSAMLVRNMGYSGYSNGGLMSTITGIACAAYYRSTGKLGGPVLAAAVVGAILGFVAVQLARSVAGV